MDEPQTPQQLNKAVANTLMHGRFALKRDGAVVIVRDGHSSLFAPATDPADALWALNKLCDDRKWGYLIEREPGSAQKSVEFSRDGEGLFFGHSTAYTEQEAICRAILRMTER